MGNALVPGLYVAVAAMGAATMDEAPMQQDIALNRQWADAAFSLDDGVSTDALPFSFVYDGRSSRELLGAWPWTLDASEEGPGCLLRTLTWRDPDTGLEVKAIAKTYLDTPGVDWTLYFANHSEDKLPVLEQVWALDTAAPTGGADPVLHRLRGSTAGVTDWLPYDDVIPADAPLTFAPQSGRSSKGASPFFNMSWEGGGVITAIGWSGRWSATLTRGEGAVHMQAGMAPMHLRLKPGESIRSPRILQLHWSGSDEERSYNLFRRTMLAHIWPRVGGEPVTPPIAHLSTSFYEMDDGTEADVLAHLESTKGLGFEYLWLDAYRGITRFPMIGHYVFPIEREVDANRFPHGLRPISEAAHAQGLKFLLWFEPERICPGSLMHEEHPEWVLIPPPERMGHGGMLDLAIPEARQYATDYLKTCIREYNIDCLRIDNAVDYAVMWSIRDAEKRERLSNGRVMVREGPERVGMAEIKYVEGLYQMWDEILEAYPHLFIDNCASGGQRIDLETCARAIPLWRTDATIHPLLQGDFNGAAICNQVITAGLSRYLPYSLSGQSGATPYQFRSGFNGGIAFCEDIRGADYPRDLLKAGIAEGKRIRKYYAGDFHALCTVTTSPEDWCVVQYHRREEQDGMVLAFRRHACGAADFTCAFRQVDPAAEYEVTLAHTYEPSPPRKVKGMELQAFPVHVDEMPGSVLIEYRRR